MSEAVTTTPLSGHISLRFLELSHFRRLGKVQMDITIQDAKALFSTGLVYDYQ